jgi:hypothetical protein
MGQEELGSTINVRHDSGDQHAAPESDEDAGRGNILLADPEALADDVLESSLYLLRERLRAT